MPPFRLLKDKFKQHKEKRADQRRNGSSSPATETDQVSSTEPAKLTCTSERAGPSDPQPLKDRDLSSKSPDLWKSAYDKFREDEHDLLEDYDKHVFGAGTVNACPGREAIETALTQLQLDRENKQWRISVLNRDIKIRVQVERVVHVLKWSDPLVKSALSTQPYAALAWSGVSLLLPLLANSATHNEAMLEGLGSIGELQEFWEAQEKTSLRSDRQQHYNDLIEPLVKLYSLFFAYQAHVICRLSKTQTSRAWKGVTGPTFWTDKLDKINKVSEHCCKLIGVSREGDSQARSDNLQREVERSRKAQEDILESIKLHRREEQETQLLKDLAEVAGDYERYKNLNPTRVPGTCEWLLMDERFCNWRENASSSLLWVSAGPGLGKSVLSKSLIDEGPLAITTMTITPSSNEPTTSTQSTVCYFFFKDGGAGLMDSAQALCALLHQLFIHPSTTGLIKYALEKHKEHGRSLTEKVHELWRILSACATASDTGEIICVLDALDECKEDSRAELFRILEEFYSQSARLSAENSKLKFLITSRPYDDLETSFRAFPDAVCLRFDGDDKSEEIRKEIDLVIDARVPDITKDFAPKDQQTISEHLKSMQHRTYLWLHLTLNMIEQSPNEYGRRCDVEKLLSGLPSRVSDAYEKILSRSKVQSRTRALLHILLAATRPLTLDEANIALALAIEEQEPNSHAQIESSLMWPKKNFRSIVTNLCGLFVTVYDSKLSFIHQTAREFLLDSKQEGNWKGSFTMPQSHSTVSRSCLLYLLLPDINEPTEDGESSQYPYLTYATHSWPVHFVSQKSVDANAFRKHARRLCETRHQAKIWAPSYFKKKSRSYDGWSDLALASFFGFSEVVEDILYQEKLQVEVNSKNKFGQTPLHWAADRGHEGITKLLLAVEQIEVNSKDKDGQTPLHWAAQQEHEGVAKLLLAAKQIEVNSKGQVGWTPLHLATWYGYEGVVKLLLAAKQIEVNSKDRDGQTPLHLAAEHEHEGVAKLLLAAKQIEVNSKDEDGQTPLHFAAKDGHEGVVKLLLAAKQVEVNSKDEDDQTPLHFAARRGREGVAKLLLAAKQIEVNSKDNNDKTPLDLAYEFKHEGIAKLLLMAE